MKALASLLPLVSITTGLLLLPGYLTQLWFATRQPRTPGRDWLETVFISLLFGLCLTGWLGLVLVELGWFSLARLVSLVLLYCLLIGWRLKGRAVSWHQLWRRGDRWTWLLLGLLLLAVLLYFHPHEYILGGGDAGVYVNLGAHVSRAGSLLYQDPELAALDPTLYPALFRQQPPDLITRYLQFPGFYVSDDQAGLVTPQFYPLHSVWLAIFYSLGGVWASLYATPLWGVLACLAVGLAATALWGRHSGVLAATLLALNATQIWFARYPTSEALTQLLLFGGIYAFSRYVADESPEMGLLAGLSLGQVMLVRPDTYFLLALPVLWVAYLRLVRRLGWRHLVFLLPFLVLSLHSLAHGLLQSWPYLHNTYVYLLTHLPMPALAFAGVISLIAFILMDAWVGGQAERLAWLTRWSRRGATGMAVLVVLAALYAYFIRPRLADPNASYAYWYVDHRIPSVQPYNLVRIGWYLSPLGIALAVLGMWWMLRHELSPQSALFLGVGLFASFLYIQNNRNNPHHIYVMRRYVPAVIPTFSVAAAYAITRWWRRRDRWRWLAWGVAALQVALLLYNARIVVRQVDHRGLVAQLTSWAKSLDPDAVILLDDDKAVSSGTVVGTPLRYLFGYTAFDLQETYLGADTLDDPLRAWQAQGRTVLVVVGPDGVREPFVTWPLKQRAGLQLNTTVLEHSYEHFPRQIRRFGLALELYELLPVTAQATFPLYIDIGSSDFFYLGQGWHGKERLPDDTTVRWTSGVAQFDFPLPEDDDLYLRLRLKASADAGHTPTEVLLRSETGVLARWQVGVSWAEYEATLPTPALPGETLALWLETDIWSPAALGLSADARELGVLVDWIKVEE
jgi:4-amino-4-deoxy-L-arabinose transferase-like glycosyltransferase